MLLTNADAAEEGLTAGRAWIDGMMAKRASVAEIVEYILKREKCSGMNGLRCWNE